MADAGTCVVSFRLVCLMLVPVGGARAADIRQSRMPRMRASPVASVKERKKPETNEGWEEDRVPTCTSRILEGRSGAQGVLPLLTSKQARKE